MDEILEFFQKLWEILGKFPLYFWIGNLFSLLAMGTDALSSTRKTARGLLVVQTVSQFFYGASSIALKGYSSAVQNGVSVMRNVFAISKQKQKWLEWVLVTLAVVLGLVFNNLRWLGLLPVVANFGYTLAVFRFKDKEYSLKFAFAINVFMFGIFNFAIQNYVSVVANVIVFVMTVVYLIKGWKTRNAAPAEKT